MMNGKYYVIDLSKLDNLTLNYGKDYSKWESASNPDYRDYQDLYIINDVTHQIYYPEGISFNGNYYFSKIIDENIINPIDLGTINDGWSVNINSTNQTNVNSDYITLSANITVTLTENYIKDSLEYAWVEFNTEDQLNNVIFSKFSLNSENSATLTSKSIDKNKDKFYLWIKVLDINGKSSIKISEAIKIERVIKIEDIEKSVYYGQQIDYDVDLGKDADGNNINIVGTADYDWEIFYYDGTNIYIIAEDCVPLSDTNGLMPTTMNNTVDSSYPYSLYWPYNNGNIQNGKTGVSDIFGSGAPAGTLRLANKFLSNWKATMTKDGATTTLSGDKENKNSNARMTATLMDTSLWEKFANSTKVKGLTNETGELVAIGGPTLEMWVASWNDKYESTRKLFTNVKADGTGYYVGTAEGTTDTYTSVSNSDKLFFPRTSWYKSCYGYWLASPSASSADREMLVLLQRLGEQQPLRRLQLWCPSRSLSTI